MAHPLVVPSVAQLHEHAGRDLGVSDWVLVSQDRIDAFAAATGDRQWIHCDVERARCDSPWKQTIAHGYLTLSLAPALLGQLLVVAGETTIVNTGCDKVRLTAPVLAGSRVRMSAEVKDVRDVARGGVRVSIGLRFEVEGSSKPACIATVNYVYFK